LFFDTTGAALFFSTYETMKPIIQSYVNCISIYAPANHSHSRDVVHNDSSISHMIAASCGEAMACLIRVPTEVIKSKMQTTVTTGSSSSTVATRATLLDTIKIVLAEKHGGVHPLLSTWSGGLYRGYGITLLREIPFAMIQFPLYEKFKYYFARYNHNRNNSNNDLNRIDASITSLSSSSCTPFQAAISGSISGGIAAAITTPLDVIKTRLMIGHDRSYLPYHGVRDVIYKTIQHDGYYALWNGIQPRVFWITLGGFIFFGAYEESKHIIDRFKQR
jgi:solute carrier family 25 (mitochondrial S-adenosylmethionine transporter), member 26